MSWAILSFSSVFLISVLVSWWFDVVASRRRSTQKLKFMKQVSYKGFINYICVRFTSSGGVVVVCWTTWNGEFTSSGVDSSTFENLDAAWPTILQRTQDFYDKVDAAIEQEEKLIRKSKDAKHLLKPLGFK